MSQIPQNLTMYLGGKRILGKNAGKKRKTQKNALKCGKMRKNADRNFPRGGCKRQKGGVDVKSEYLMGKKCY